MGVKKWIEEQIREVMNFNDTPVLKSHLKIFSGMMCQTGDVEGFQRFGNSTHNRRT
jgi:hypothetical protein